MRRSLFGLLGVIAVSFAQAEPARPANGELDLPAIPAVPRRDPAAPTAEDLDDLDSRLERLLKAGPDERVELSRELLEVRPQLVSALSFRLLKLSERCDKERMKKLFLEAREHHRERRKGGTTAGDNDETDVFQTVLRRANPNDANGASLIRLLAMSRMLAMIATVDAGRALIDIYVRFGEFMRVDTQLQLQRMGEHALAPLIESRRHPAEKVARWAERLLDQMGRAIPSEAIRTDDYEVLADVLRAFGRIREPDAARIIVTFANSERTQVRDAARQGIAMLAEVGLWQLRDAYENVVGRRPKREWTWDRTARELFGEYDRLRLSRVYQLYSEGVTAQGAGNLKLMTERFDAVLSKDPMFERRATMAVGYFSAAEQRLDSEPKAAELALARVERLSEDPALRARASSLRLTLSAERTGRERAADVETLRRALALDPANRRAQAALAQMERGEATTRLSRSRTLAALAIGLTTLIGLLVIVLSPRRRSAPPQSKASGTPPDEPLTIQVEPAVSDGGPLVSTPSETAPPRAADSEECPPPAPAPPERSSAK